MLHRLSVHRRGSKAIEASPLLQKEKEYEQCKDIRAMLLLLKNITDRELASEAAPKYLDIAHVRIPTQGLSHKLSCRLYCKEWT